MAPRLGVWVAFSLLAFQVITTEAPVPGAPIGTSAPSVTVRGAPATASNALSESSSGAVRTDAPERDVGGVGVNATASNFWSGYVYCPVSIYLCNPPSNGSRVLGAQGSFTVPAILPNSPVVPQSVDVWVGVGGFQGPSLVFPDLIQAGVEAATTGPSPNSTAYRAWWETLWNDQAYVNLSPNPRISPHDAMTVSVVFVGVNQSGQQLWSFLIRDETTRSNWTGTEPCADLCVESGFSSADWIVENPTIGSSRTLQAPAPPFGSVQFQGAEYLNASSGWQELSEVLRPLYRVTLIAGSPVGTVAAPSQVYENGTFWVQYLVDTSDDWMQGDWGNVSVGDSRGGPVLFGNLSINGSSNVEIPVGSGLGIAFELSNRSAGDCLALPSPYAPLELRPGEHSYAAEAPLCPDLRPGRYTVSLALWFSNPGAVPGSNGSLELFATGPLDAATVWVNSTAPSATGPSPLWLWLALGATGGASALALLVSRRVARSRGPRDARP